jgi:L-iditol 2-dehydrogenase
MRAAVVSEPNKISIKEIKKPVCGEDEVLIKVESCGVCGSDLRIFRHGNNRVTFPAVLGHEVAGVVAEKGREVPGFEIGDRVAMGADIPCGKCQYCLAGQCNNCQENLALGYQYQGGFAEFIKADKKIWDGGPIEKIPDSLSFDQAAVAEPVACVINGLEILPNPKKETLVIFGAGVMGCLFTEVAPHFGYSRIFLLDIKKERLDQAQKKGFVTEESLVYNSNIQKLILKKTGGQGADAVIVAAASSEAQIAALQMAGKRGAVNLFAGLPPKAANLSFPSNLIHYNEIFLTGSHGSTPKQYKKSVELIAEGKVKVQKSITHFFKLEDIAKAFEIIEKKAGLKIIIHPNE